MSESGLRRASELALVAIASVWGLIMTAIVAVEVVPRFRPPRPLPEG